MRYALIKEIVPSKEFCIGNIDDIGVVRKIGCGRRAYINCPFFNQEVLFNCPSWQRILLCDKSFKDKIVNPQKRYSHSF